MTIRDKIKKQVLWGVSVQFGGFLLLMAGVILGTVFEPWEPEPVFEIAGGGVLAAGILWLLAGVRCPKCGNGILWSNSNRQGMAPWRFDRKHAKCPFCHVNLDDELA